MRKKIHNYALVFLVTFLVVACKPVANPQSLETFVNTPLDITLTASDQDGDPLTYQLKSQPVNGVVQGTPPQVTYIPDAGFVGADQFGFVANDGSDDSTEAFISITVKYGSANDIDGDGVINSEDAFPEDPSPDISPNYSSSQKS